MAGLGLAIVLLVLVPAAYVTVSSARRAEELAAQVTTGTFDKDRADFQRNLLQYETDSQVKVWTGLLQASTAIVGGAAGLIAWRNLRETQRKLDVDRESQITNRFTQAITQLGTEKDGKPNLEVRLGGIYALERIAKDSSRDHWTIMEVLTAYVRQNAPWRAEPSPPVPGSPPIDEVIRRAKDLAGQAAPEPPDFERLRTDIRAILTVLGRRRAPGDFSARGQLDLSGTDLRGADFWGAHWEEVNFGHAHLEQARFQFAHLEGADFSYAHLRGAFFGFAYLREAVFQYAHLEGADFRAAHLDGADFEDAYELTPTQVLSTFSKGRDAILPRVPQRWTEGQQEAVEAAWEEEAEPEAVEGAWEEEAEPARGQVPTLAPDAAAAPAQRPTPSLPTTSSEADGSGAPPRERTPAEPLPPTGS